MRKKVLRERYIIMDEVFNCSNAFSPLNSTNKWRLIELNIWHFLENVFVWQKICVFVMNFFKYNEFNEFVECTKYDKIPANFPPKPLPMRMNQRLWKMLIKQINSRFRLEIQITYVLVFKYHIWIKWKHYIIFTQFRVYSLYIPILTIIMYDY